MNMPSLTRIILLAVVLFVPAAHAANTFPFIITDSLTNADPTQMGRVSRSGEVSTIPVPKAFSGISDPGMAFNFKTYSILNPFAAPLQVLVKIKSDSTKAFFVAYSGTYNPASLGSGYLGDCSVSRNGTIFFAVSLPASQTLTLVASGTDAAGTLAAPVNYTIKAVPCFSNTANVTVQDNAVAATYPITFDVSALSGLLQGITLMVNGFSHASPADVDMLLVGPRGQKCVLMSDAGNAAVVPTIFAIDDISATQLPSTGPDTFDDIVYTPSDFGEENETFPAPAPASPYVFSMRFFKNTDPNGTWKLFILDDAAGGTGLFAGGFSLGLQTSGPLGIPEDNDLDGFPDEIENAVSTDPNDINSTPAGGSPLPGAVQNLVLEKPQIALNFKKMGVDSIKGGGTLHIPAGFNVFEQRVVLSAGGVTGVFVLNAKGKSPAGAKTFQLTVKTTKKMVLEQDAKYKFKLSKGTFLPQLADEGFINETATFAVPVQFSILFNNALFKAKRELNYKGVLGKTGTWK